MAIGLSLTPRSYNVDPTGRDYVLDPDPLLNVAEKSFAAQRENLRSMAGVMQQGVALGEMIGARQQLGRVKAGLSELNVDDPLFAQKYSSLVAENPLAFTNERIAPVTKAAITPVLASAAQAMESRAALERAKVMAGYQRQGAIQRAGLQRDYYDYQRMNPRPVAPKPPSAGERLLFGDQASAAPAAAPVAAPPAESYSSPDYTESTNGVYAPQLPVPREGEAPIGTGPDLTDPYYPPPDGPAFEPDDTVTGEQGDSSGMAFSNGVLQSPTGVWDVSSVSADGVTAQPRRVAARPETPPEPGKRWTAKSYNVDNSVAEYGQEPIPESILKQRNEVYDALIDTDPGIAALNQNAALLGETYKAAKDSLTNLPEDKKGTAAEALVPQAAAAAIATSAAAAAKAQAKVQMLAGEFPEAAAIYNARAREAQANAIRPQGTGEYGYEDLLFSGAPAKPAAPVVEPSVREQLAQQTEQLAQQTNSQQRQAWDQEKRFAMQEAKSLALRLGLRENALIDAFAKDDREAINLIQRTAAERGVLSPLLTETMMALPTPSVRPGFTGSSVPTAITRDWARSGKLGRTYKEILRAAAQDPNYKGEAGVTPTNSGYRIGVPLTKK